MIAVDTSALMAVLLEEKRGAACRKALESTDQLLMSATTLAEALVVAGGRGVQAKMRRLIDELPFEIETVTAASAVRVADAYTQWGRGLHPAGLNFGDCFAYALAKERSCPLLFVGDDFSKTDLRSALQAGAPE
jgi:ribonuclease VapC